MDVFAHHQLVLKLAVMLENSAATLLVVLDGCKESLGIGLDCRVLRPVVLDGLLVRVAELL